MWNLTLHWNLKFQVSRETFFIVFLFYLLMFHVKHVQNRKRSEEKKYLYLIAECLIIEKDT